MRIELSTQTNTAMSDGFRNVIQGYMEEHPHETKLIGWIGVLMFGILGICTEGAALCNRR